MNATLPPHVFDQSPYRCRLARGRRGAKEAAARGDIIVVIDTLSFSTAAVTAVHYGGIIYPCPEEEDRFAFAQRVQAEATVGRPDVPTKGRFSLSPTTYLNLQPNTRIVVASPNGATCSRYAHQASYLLVGTLINAHAVAQALTHLITTTDHTVTILACGERWTTPDEDGPLRVALEDDLGAGAIISYLTCDKSPEARACEGTFHTCQTDLNHVLADCASGRELIAKGYQTDVAHAAQLSIYNTVPIMKKAYLTGYAF